MSRSSHWEYLKIGRVVRIATTVVDSNSKTEIKVTDVLSPSRGGFQGYVRNF